MRELWDKARQYGKVMLFTADDGTYSCIIIFSTIPGVNLEAKSGFRHVEPEKAIEAAIARCEEIVNGMAQQVADLKRLR